jgi:hypothetical protein
MHMNMAELLSLWLLTQQARINSEAEGSGKHTARP